MHDCNAQDWFDLYRTALLELQRAAITVRIRDARTGMTTRLPTLRQRPDLHHTELSAIQDSQQPPCIGARGRAPSRRGQEAHSASGSANAQGYRTQVRGTRTARLNNKKGVKHGMNIPVELTESEFVLLIQLLGNDLVGKAPSGIDTNRLPETALMRKLLNARAKMVGDKPLPVRAASH